MSHKDFELFPNELSSWNLWRYLFKLSCLKTKAVGIMASQHVKKTLPEKQTVENNTKVNCYLDTGQKAISLDFL